jgi:putative transcriptional regulator
MSFELSVRSVRTSLPCLEARLVKNRVKVLRAERDWSQADLAQRVGVSRQTINSIETERYDPSLALGLKLAELFEQPVERIFSLDG